MTRIDAGHLEPPTSPTYSAKKDVLTFSLSELQSGEGGSQEGWSRGRAGGLSGVGGTVQGRSGLERGSSRKWERGSREGLPANF